MKPGAETDLAGAFSALAAGGHSVILRGFSAIDAYLGLPPLPFVWADTSADIAVLAKYIENLRFPGVDLADGAVDTPDGTCYFRCLDSEESPKSVFTFPLLSYGCDVRTGRFIDPLGTYPLLRGIRARRKNFVDESDEVLEQDSRRVTENSMLDFFTAASGAGRYRCIMDGALLLARYSLGVEVSKYFSTFAKTLRGLPSETAPGVEAQRAFLSCLLVSPRPDRALDFCKRTLFLDELWPELACYDDVDHSKEFHPEGNVWNHTLETFRHRKAGANGAYDLRLSLGLLLHDAGKPISAANGNRRFDGHAELGAHAAVRFLERLEFDPSLVFDISFLVKNHMLPAALKRLPFTKTGEIMASPLFPTLMELYRCDESSSFKGLDGYYENSAAYQAYLKNVRNPYRSPDGKKMGKRSMYNGKAR